MDDSKQLEQLYREFIPSGVPGASPDRDHIQQVLTRKFVKLLNTRHDLDVSTVVETFAGVWEGSLSWLGEERQDAILKTAMQETGVDLTAWIGTDKE